MRTEDVLFASRTGLWRWDHATGLVWLDAVAAGLVGLPGEETSITESDARARIHVEDFIDLARIVTLATAENRPAEGRMRIVDTHGTVRRRLRVRIRARGEGNEFVLVGTMVEVPEKPGSGSEATGDWRLSREAFLLDAGRSLAEARTTTEVLRVASSLALPGFTPSGQVVFGLDGNRLEVLGHHGYFWKGDKGLQRLTDFFHLTREHEYPAVDAIRTGRAVYLPSPGDYERRYPGAWATVHTFGRQAWAYLPLTVGGRPIGAWMAAFPHKVTFSPDERSVLTTVARMLAQALARTHVFETERAFSEDLQHTMRPVSSPAVPGLELTARYVPAGGGLQVGGDWYDVIPLSSGRVAVIMGDVQGHDVRAAAIMAQVRIALRAYAAEGHPPDAVLTRASRFLSGISSPDDERFATCLYLEIDPPTGALNVARAGHPDLAVRVEDGTTATRPTAGGPPLGVFPDWSYPTTRMALQPHEVLMLYTDGLLETGGHDVDSGWARLHRVLHTHPAHTLELLADALIETVHGPPSHRVRGPLTDRREDDSALLLIRRKQWGETPRRTVLSIDQAEPARIAEARHQLADLLHDWADREQVDGAVLVLSEVLTNVLLHTDSAALMVAEVTGPRGSRRLRVEVADSSDDLPHRREPGEMASSGRGLLLMEVIADAWGVDPRGHGKSTWFEMREGPDPEHPPGADGPPG